MILAWGVPGAILIDNGKEYRIIDHADDMLKLAARLTGNPMPRAINRARAYQAETKPVEGAIAALHLWFQTMPGYIGPNRMKSKTANRGKPPTPFRGNLAEIEEHAGRRVALHNATPQTTDGRSPDTRFAAFVQAGFQPIAIRRDALRLSFCKRVEVTVRQCSVKLVVAGARRRYSCEEMTTRFSTGDRVTACVPLLDDSDHIVILDPKDHAFHCLAELDDYAIESSEGPAEKARRKRSQNKVLRRDAQALVEVDIDELERLQLSQKPKHPEPALRAEITLSGALEDARQSLAKKAQKPRKPSWRELDADEQARRAVARPRKAASGE
jgi:hypothetical protein